MDLHEKRRGLPPLPGVYLMKDTQGDIIYVGKSKNLKNRVSSYFQNSSSHSPKVLKLVKNLKDFEYILTDTEFEAFLLECKLIHELKPIYNKLMKSPLSYTYIQAKINGKYPQIELSNEVSKEDGYIYFGPYTNKNTVQRALDGIKECCKILCSNNSRKSSACLNYSLGLCLSMCLESTTQEQMNLIYDKILNLLKGIDNSILEEMFYNMNASSEKLDFESASKYRDYISAVNYILNKKNVIEFAKENKNIALIEYLDDNNFKFFLIKGNKLLFSEKYPTDSSDIDKLKSTLKENIINYFNSNNSNENVEVGKEDLDEAQIIYSYLKNNSNNCKYVIIEDQWLHQSNDLKIDKAINRII